MDKNHLIEIYKVEAEKYNKTRDIHWKMNIAMWTLLIVALYAKMKGEIKSLPIPCEICMCLLFVFLHIVFIGFIHGSLNRSLTRMKNMSNYLIRDDNVPIQNFDSFDSPRATVNSGWEFLQAAIGAILLAIYVSTGR
ncbi:MAG TPA: hypothetical protein VKR53_15105 [Puia sp.]|nr:hypothetical protein [Puia sp.]